MSYTPNNWKSGDVVTSAKLNAMEQGIAAADGAALVVGATVEGSTITLDKTWQEIFEGNYVAVRHDDGTREFITQILAGKTSFYVTAGETTYECAEETDYPSYTGK